MARTSVIYLFVVYCNYYYKNLRFLPADKGNATVVLSNTQYLAKVHDHLDNPAYSIDKTDPTNRITRNLNNILNKLCKENKIDTRTKKSMQCTNPRYPQLWGGGQPEKNRKKPMRF